MQALQTLFDTKQKAKVLSPQVWKSCAECKHAPRMQTQMVLRQEEIKATAAKRSTQVLQELPKKIQDAEKLRTGN